MQGFDVGKAADRVCEIPAVEKPEVFFPGKEPGQAHLEGVYPPDRMTPVPSHAKPSAPDHRRGTQLHIALLGSPASLRLLPDGENLSGPPAEAV